MPLLPTADVAALDLPQTGARTITFPDGSQIQATTHSARILLAGGQEPRMGLKLLWGYRISMKFVEGGAVTVERL